MYIHAPCTQKATCMMTTIDSRRVAIFSDIHLGVHQDGLQWHKIAMEWADWFVDQLKLNKIDTVIFCGDFFHYRDSVAVNTMSLASSLLDKFANYRLIMIPGNHDCYYKESSEINSISILKNYPNIEVLETPTVYTHNNRKLSFVPWGFGVDDIPKSDIVFGHFEINSFKMNSFKVCENGIKMPRLLKKAPLIVSGHFHTRSERVLDNGAVLYVGNPYPMDFGDTATTKGIYILDLQDRSYEFIENVVSPKFHKIYLSELIKHKGITDDIRNMFIGNMVRLIVDRIISSEDAEFLFTKLRSLRPLQFDVEHDVSFDLIMQSGEDADLSGVDIESAIHEFVDMLDIDNKSQILDYTISLYKKKSLT